MSSVTESSITDDAEFQAGIQAIVSNLRAQGASEEDIEDTIAQARSFYMERKSNEHMSESSSAVMKGISATESSTDSSHMTSDNQPSYDGDKEKYPSSFSAIVELIATGREDQLTNIRDIPLKINEEPPSESKMERPKKPWEQA